MESENIVEVDKDEVSKFMQSETVTVGDTETALEDVMSDIQTAHSDLDEYKSGAVSLAQTLSEASDNTNNEALEAILADLSDGAFAIYLRLHRGDKELMGERNGEYSGFLEE